MRTSVVLLIITIVLSFFMFGRKLADYLGSFYAPAEAGECIKVNAGGIPVKLHIVDNYERSSVVYVINNSSTHEITFLQLREMDAEEVSCD